MPVAFVAGATGYTGREVVRLLRQRGVRTVAHIRPDSPQLETWRERFVDSGAEIDTTPWEPAAMAATLARLQPSYVFSLLGTTRARGSRARSEGRDPARESYQTVDYGMTAMLIQGSVQAGNRPRFIYLSSMGVSAGAPGEYLQVRWKAEQELRASGLPFIIARPGIISGPDRDEPRLGERVAAQAMDGLLSVAGMLGARRLQDKYKSVTGAELAAALIQAAFQAGDQNRLLEAGDLHG